MDLETDGQCPPLQAKAKMKKLALKNLFAQFAKKGDRL